MAKIIVLGAMKGGVGKSVSTFNLAYSLAELGKKVLAVDFDSQANLTTCMVEQEHYYRQCGALRNMISGRRMEERKN